MIKNVVIVGGGIAGWYTAHLFLRKINPNITVTLVSTDQIPVIGVGEGTTGTFNQILHSNTTGLIHGERPSDFLKETESTFKLGVKHTDWYNIGHHFYSPIGGEDSNRVSPYPHLDYDSFRIFHIAEQLPFNKTLESRLMSTNRLHLLMGQNHYDKKVAFHLDTKKVGEYLKKNALLNKNCKHIEGKIKSFVQDENGLVTSLVLDDGRIVEGDLYVDCSGFSRVLIDKIVNNPWVSYNDNLLVDSAITFTEKHEGEIKNYTEAKALKYGWSWKIPTQTRVGCGYVFSSKFIDENKAEEELGSVDIQKHIKFNSGRLEKQWCKNVIATGLAGGFLEPLEATSIHATIIQIYYWLDNYYKPELNFNVDLFQEQYNDTMSRMWDDLRDFIVFHYITPRNDTDFWIESSDKKRWSPRLSNLLEMWKYRMPRVVDFITNDVYYTGNTLWYQIAMGMNILDSTLAKDELKEYNLYEELKQFYNISCSEVERSLYNYPKTCEYYNNITK